MDRGGLRPAACSLILLATAGCVTVIRPPTPVGDPVSVVVLDYGHQSSLLLPSPEGGSVEYAYGEWDWFALNRDEWYRACPTLCCPNPGALGRRRLSIPATSAAAAGVVRCRESIEVRVERAKVDSLLKSLDESFQKGLETRVDNALMQLEFVRYEVDYCFLVNCNHLVGRWLLELGCGLGGSACFSSFRVERTPVADAPSDR